MPVNPDEAVVENRLDAGDGLPGFFVLCVLDQRCLRVSTKRHLSRRLPPRSPTDFKVVAQGSSSQVMSFYLDVNDGSELAEVFVELRDVVEIPGDLPHLQFGVHVMVALGKAALILVVEARPEKDIFDALSGRRNANIKKLTGFAVQKRSSQKWQI